MCDHLRMTTTKLQIAPDVRSFGDWLIERMNHLGMSSRDVAAASGADADGRPLVSHATVTAYGRGARDPATMSDTVIEGLSRALRTPVRAVRERAGIVQPLGKWNPPAESAYLTLADRRTLDALVRRLAVRTI